MKSQLQQGISAASVFGGVNAVAPAKTPNPYPGTVARAGFADDMAIQVTLTEEVAIVLATCIKAQLSCAHHDQVASQLSIPTINRMDQELNKLAQHLLEVVG